MSDLNDLTKPNLQTSYANSDVPDTLLGHIKRLWIGDYTGMANLVTGMLRWAVTGTTTLSARFYQRNSAGADVEVTSLPGISIGGSAATVLDGAITPKKIAAGSGFYGIFDCQKTITNENIDLLAASFFSRSINQSTFFNILNTPSSSGVAAVFILELTNAGAYSINWWSGLTWATGVAPMLTATGRDVLGFYTLNGGTTWTGLVLVKDAR